METLPNWYKDGSYVLHLKKYKLDDAAYGESSPIYKKLANLYPTDKKDYFWCTPEDERGDYRGFVDVSNSSGHYFLRYVMQAKVYREWRKFFVPLPKDVLKQDWLFQQAYSLGYKDFKGEQTWLQDVYEGSLKNDLYGLFEPYLRLQFAAYKDYLAALGSQFESPWLNLKARSNGALYSIYTEQWMPVPNYEVVCKVEND